MAQEYFEILFRLVAALAAGSLIGLERSHRGRPAGFRTHALVCLASSLLMLVTVYETHWFPDIANARVILDPTRMAQGIMTGIGFVGAGAIIKEGFTVRGLTTAASIWVTAAIGILTGIGFYFAAVVGTLLALGPSPVVPPTFVGNNVDIGVFWQLLARDLARHGGAFATLGKRCPSRFLGDLAAGGKGELLVVA